MSAQKTLSTLWRGVSIVAIMLLALGAVGRGAAEGANIFVTSLADKVSDSGGCSLKEAILSANTDSNLIPLTGVSFFMTGCVSGSGDDTIILPVGQVILLSRIVDDEGNPFGPTATPMITSRITIEMNGTRLQWAGSGSARAFAVASSGDLTIRDAYITDFVAKGGNGAYGGGGGLGAGGAIYVKGSGSLTVDSSTFEHNGAFGGRGGGGNAGGGGGMGGNGGTGGDALGGGFYGGGGGGGGSRGNGGTAKTPTGGGGGGTLTNGASTGGSGGFRCGAAGGAVGFFNTDGNNASCPGGGGGGGSGDVFGLVDNPGNGGNGFYGGGGGGGGGTGNGGTDGGRGDFGGGGGAAGGSTSNFLGDGPSGGNGGFGGGGGAGVGGYLPGPLGGGAGHGGLFGGDASHTGGGGGGALGGAIFSDGGTLTIVNSTFTRNFVSGSVGGNSDASYGSGAGAAIFSLNGTTTIESSTISLNNTSNFTGAIGVIQLGSPTAFTLRNTIVYDNGGLACGVAVATPTVAGSNNLIQDNNGCPGAITDADPTLGPLQMNGGLTPTMAITDSSPAFDAGGVLPTEHFDQRGARRPQGSGFDIGAFEACVFNPREDCFGFHAFVFTRHLDTSAFPAVGGAVSPPSGDYPLNSVQPLKATPNAGFSFLNWTGTVGDPNSASTFIAMDQDHVVTANFAGCAINVSGRGTAGTAIAPPRVDLTWAPNGADHANIFRSATSGGPYAFVGTSTTTSFTDTTAGLVNNTRAYYMLQFFASATVKMCDSNEVGVTVPRGR